ncbi:MAG TPA: hypothetical protein VNJ51_05430 [Candidatus Dormibacteraeota bacterium]|nr:hypothetical protein [Candidatus Dormibacteraeota bacterium]
MILVALVVGVRGLMLAMRARRLGRKLDHPLLARLAKAAADVQRFDGVPTRADQLSARVAALPQAFSEAGEQRERLRREARRAIAEIAGDIRAIRDLLA